MDDTCQAAEESQQLSSPLFNPHPRHLLQKRPSPRDFTKSMLDSDPNHLFPTSPAKWKFKLADLTAVFHVNVANLSCFSSRQGSLLKESGNLDRKSHRCFFKQQLYRRKILLQKIPSLPDFTYSSYLIDGKRIFLIAARQ